MAASILGCATQTGPVSDAPDANQMERSWVLGGAGMLPAQTTAPFDDTAPLKLTNEMKEFAREATAHAWSDGSKIITLVNAMHADDGLALRYDATATLTAQQAFEQHRANCISHTMLFIAMARSVGIPARFNNVEIPPIWDMRNQDMILYRHINARVEAETGTYQVVDATIEEFDSAYRQHVVSDTQALAQFYSNRAVDLNSQGSFSDALRHQLHALELDPERSFLWSNLAHLYLGKGNARAAEICIRRSLSLEHSNLAAYGTAMKTYDALGDHNKALEYRRKALLLMRNNPYYHFQLAQDALQRDLLPRAYSETRRAIELYPEDQRFLMLMGVVLVRLDQPELARKSIEAAIAMTADETLQSRYRSKLDRLIPVKAGPS